MEFFIVQESFQDFYSSYIFLQLLFVLTKDKPAAFSVILTAIFALGTDLILFSLRGSFHNSCEKQECILEQVHIQYMRFLYLPRLLWMDLLNSIDF